MENEDLIINEDIEPTPEPEPFVIPDIYNYKPDTKEFTGIVEKADKDNAKSAQVGHFVSLVHANATLLEPPEVEENQIQVYSKEVIEHKETDSETGEEIISYEVIENWNVEADYRKNFLKIDNDLNVTDITTIGEQTGYIVVDKTTGEDIKANKDWYKIVDDEVVKKSEEEYEQEQAEKERQRLDALTLTPSDVERALYYSELQMDFDDLKELIKTKAPQIDLKGLAIEFRANNFFRGAVGKDGNRIIDMVGLLLGYNSDDMDYLFQHKELPKKNNK